MNKTEFLAIIHHKLQEIPQEDLQKSLDYYSEMIEDRMEEGLTEEEAVAAMGTPEEVAGQILAEIPLPRLIRTKMKPKEPLPLWVIVLLIVGSPVWGPIAVAILAVILSVYLGLWSGIIGLYSGVLGLWCGALGCLVSIPFAFAQYSGWSPVGLCIGAALICVGLGILLLLGTNALAKLLVKLAKVIVIGLKKLLIRKEEEK